MTDASDVDILVSLRGAQALTMPASSWQVLRACSVLCEVLAPSKPHRPVGELLETAARDVVHAAKLSESDELVMVMIPSKSPDAARRRVRVHKDARRDLVSARSRLGSLLLRRGVTHSGKTA